MSVAQLEACPSWCTTTAQEHADDDPGRPLHRGPWFGPFQAWECGGELTADINNCDLTAAGLRQLAADALAAAEWLEAHQ